MNLTEAEREPGTVCSACGLTAGPVTLIELDDGERAPMCDDCRLDRLEEGIAEMRYLATRVVELEELLREIHPFVGEDIRITIEGTLGAEPQQTWVPAGQGA